MQTFLPYHPEKNENNQFFSFKNSAQVLDQRRLGKQRVEGYQILQILCGKDARWKNHPAVLQWKGCEWILFDYVGDICLEWIGRGFKDTIYDKIDELELPKNVFTKTLPDWMNRDEIFASHRSRLLFKGRVDTAIQSLKQWLTLRKFKVNDFLKQSGYPKPNVFKHDDIIQLEAFLNDKDITIEPNHYAQFGWLESDDMPYVWPVRNIQTV